MQVQQKENLNELGIICPRMCTKGCICNGWEQSECIWITKTGLRKEKNLVSFTWQALFVRSCRQIRSLSLESLNVIGKFAKGANCDSLTGLWWRFWKIRVSWTTGVLFSLTTASQLLISCWLNTRDSSDNFQRSQPPICPAHSQLPNEKSARYPMKTEPGYV